MDDRTNFSNPTSERLIAEEAVQWFEKLKAGTAEDTGTRREFAEWLKRSPRNVHYFLFSTALDKTLESIDADRKLDVGKMIAQASQGVVKLENTSISTPSRAVNATATRKRWTATAAMLSILVVASTIGGRLWYAHRAQAYVTSIGEQRTVQLPDGSIVQLNTDSRIEVRYTQHQRVVRLQEGEALFKVSKDGTRPFRVVAGDDVIQALGTQFNVYRQKDGVEIAVLEGKVAVQTIVLEAGEEAKVARGSVKKLRTADVSSAVAWRQRRLVFKVTSLSDMVMEFNRYNRAPKIRLEGIDGTQRHYTGTFDADDPGSLALLLSNDAQLSVQNTADGIVIKPR